MVHCVGYCIKGPFV